ncbi:MAG: YgiQ family radical SAM protein, partial [Oscillospiraceae bacterium]|nr:YgiQ family radical SAM protein [Oscillospiraceae bacterium]
MPFLPLTTEDFAARNWDQPDVILITGDAYVDHPSFGIAVIGRVLEAAGHRVAVIAQPRSPADYQRFGAPRLGFFVTGGNIDSMVCNYTAARRRRSDDPYSPGNISSARPDRALTVYCRAVRAHFGDIPLIIGGLEASLRRFAHYDYWADRVMPSVLVDTTADLLVFGMGETAAVEIAGRLAAGEPVGAIRDVRGTVYAVPVAEYEPGPCAECPSFEAVGAKNDTGFRAYAAAARIQYQEQDAVRGKRIIQRHGSSIIVQNPPAAPLDGPALDVVYALPYMREVHPSYGGTVASIEEVKFSLTHTRGCFGGCSFCSLAFHQGRRVTARSADSVVTEAEKLAAMPDFKGYIHDVGGPTANFRQPSCDKQSTSGVCRDRRCLVPKPCPSLQPDHSEYLHLLRRLRKIPGVKKVFIRSGIRFDYLMADPNGDAFFRELVAHHISGQ